MADIRKAGLLTLRDGHMLLCRKKKKSSTARLILPGGKIERGETALECLRREIHEELGGKVKVVHVEYIDTYLHLAAGKGFRNGRQTVEIQLFSGELRGEPKASSEIDELIWFSETDDRRTLAPSLVEKIIPDLVSRRLLPWRR
jgi:8-oxo-dGTP diphosphatase